MSDLVIRVKRNGKGISSRNLLNLFVSQLLPRIHGLDAPEVKEVIISETDTMPYFGYQIITKEA